MEPSPITEPVERDGARVHDVRVADATEAYVVEPLGGGRGAAVLFLHWFDPEAPDGNRTQFLDEASELARDHGVVSILPQGRFPWSEPPTDAGHDFARIRAEVEGHQAAIEVLAARPDVAQHRIAVVGHDFGGMHGIVLAAREPRVSAVVAVAATPRWGDWFLPFWPIAGDRWDYLRELDAVDPIARIGEIAPRPVLLQFARHDFYIADMTGLELPRGARRSPGLPHGGPGSVGVTTPAKRRRVSIAGRLIG
jgi:pimeloyl-ACP methyl ester carboxylesterase